MTLLVTAQPPRVALLEVHDGAPACVALDEVRADVRARLGGREPFDEAAPRKVELRWSRRQRQFVAKIDVVEPDGQRGERVLVDRSCAELVPAVALAIAIAIDPRVALGPLPPDPVRVTRVLEAESRAARATLDEPAPRPTPPPRRTPLWRFGVATGLSFGAVPGPGVGLAARLELGAEWRAALEAGIAAGMPADVGVTSVTALGVTTHVQACHVERLSVCAGLGYEHLRFGADRGLATPVDEGRDMLAVIATGGVQVTDYLRIELALTVPLTQRYSFTDGADVVWRAWPVQPSLRALVSL